MTTLPAHLKSINACEAAIAWVATLPKNVTLKQAWAKCERADWMLWLCVKANRGENGTELHRALVMASVLCASTALPFIKKQETRDDITACLDLLSAWVDGADIDVIQIRRAAAYAAADAAYAAAYAADAAAATAYAAADARKKVLAHMADIVRDTVPIRLLESEFRKAVKL